MYVIFLWLCVVQKMAIWAHKLTSPRFEVLQCRAQVKYTTCCQASVRSPSVLYTTLQPCMVPPIFYFWDGSKHVLYTSLPSSVVGWRASVRLAGWPMQATCMSYHLDLVQSTPPATWVLFELSFELCIPFGPCRCCSLFIHLLFQFFCTYWWYFALHGHLYIIPAEWCIDQSPSCEEEGIFLQLRAEHVNHLICATFRMFW